MTHPTLAHTTSILCGNPDFQHFLCDHFPRAWSESGDFRDPDRAVAVVRSTCRIKSRTELDTDLAAARRYRARVGLAFSTWRCVRCAQSASSTH